MDKKELQKKLNKPYTTQNWQEVVQFVFPNAQILNPPMVIPINNDKVELFRQIGNVRLQNGKNLALFELKLKENVNILRNRVELNNIVSQYIDQDQNHGVLSIFEQGKDDYRFTFTARSSEFDDDEGDFKTTKTDTKRFTYVLGKNESCKTPASQFFELSNNKDLKIEDVIKAFNITKLNDDFFNEYKTIYNNIVEFFTGKKLVKVGGKWEEKTTSKPDAQLTYIFKNNELEARNFVKMLLGRIVFLKFVQKKGWMGVPKTRTDWKEGNIRFLEETFENFKHKELFYSTFLSHLFFDALNNPNRKDDVFKLTDSKIPYLSGGLFDEDNLKTKEIIIPEKHFEDIFEFLDKYNFTIDENSDIDDKNEFSVDPEMLGHIFENLLEDNKDKGAFYTPKEIVRYMCQESLKEYLKTSLENNNQWPSDETEAAAFEKSLHNFVAKKEARGIIEFDVTIARALKEVKICDPAIGSGAFPMGLLNEIFQLVHKLHEANPDKVERVWELDGWQPNLVKQNIIQNSIYGVDIEKGAVDVARLRFWLSLIVDEPEPKALPHLDYKIVVGNSLVSKLDDTIIDIDWNLDETQQGFFGSTLAQERAEILKKISDKQKAVFDPNSDEEKLSLEIRNLKIDLLCKQLELMINSQNIPKEPKIADYQNKTKAKFAQDQAKYFETVGWKNQITKLEKLKKQPEAPLHFFDWKLDFPEIMNEQVTDKVGFDIVIGNPPYVRQERLGLELKEVYKKRFPQVANGTADLYVYFFNIGLELLKKDSVLSYITLNKFLKTKYGVELRNLLAKSYHVDIIIDFFELPVFEASTDACITKIINTNEPNFTKYYPVKTLEKLNLFQLISGVFQNVLKDDNEWKFVDNSNEIILDKIYKDTISLKKFTGDNIYYGVKTGANHIFIIDEVTKIEITKNCTESIKYIHPYIEPTKFKKWEAEKSKKYLIGTFPSLKLDIDKITGIKKYLNSFKKELEPKPKGHIGEWHGRKSGSYKWFETQDNIKYWELFFSPKLIFIHTAKKHEFYFDNEGHLINNSCYFISSNSVFLFSFLNSKVFEWLKKIKFVAYGDATESGRAKLDYNKMITVPIKKVTDKTEKIFTTLFLEGQKQKEKDKPTTEIEQQIDNLVYKLYELTYEEVLVVEPEFSERMSKVEYDSLKLE